VGGEILRGANFGGDKPWERAVESGVLRTNSLRDDDDGSRGRTVRDEVRTSSSSCSCSSLTDVRSESNERRPMIVLRVDAVIGKAVRMDASAREGRAGDPEPEPEPDLVEDGIVEYWL